MKIDHDSLKSYKSEGMWHDGLNTSPFAHIPLFCMQFTATYELPEHVVKTLRQHYLKEERKLRKDGRHIFRIRNWEIRHEDVIRDVLLDLRDFIGFS